MDFKLKFQAGLSAAIAALCIQQLIVGSPEKATLFFGLLSGVLNAWMISPSEGKNASSHPVLNQPVLNQPVVNQPEDGNC
jgi:hypothetical protein